MKTKTKKIVNSLSYTDGEYLSEYAAMKNRFDRDGAILPQMLSESFKKVFDAYSGIDGVQILFCETSGTARISSNRIKGLIRI